MVRRIYKYSIYTVFLLLWGLVCQCSRPVGDMLPEFIMVDVIAPPVYSISGYVKGLLGQNLRLGNNNDSVIISASDSDPLTNDNFTFPENLRTLERYSISILDHPGIPTQLCELTENTASGVVVNSDIKNIEVICQDAYRVDGLISGGDGLLGSGLTLTINSSDSISLLSGDTGFVFDTPVSTLLYGTSGSTVNISAQPVNPWQDCYFGTPGVFSTSTGTNITVDTTLSTPLTCTLKYFNVYANITGLVYDGLVVNINGANYTYTAGTVTTDIIPMASGDLYGISITSQPPGQNCAIFGGGNGVTTVVEGSNVVASISCSVNTYNAGSSISGLSGSGLQLEIQGTLNSGGPFTKSVLVNPGASQYVIAADLNYGDTIATVSITAQPAGPDQYCSFADGSITYSYTGGSIAGSVTLQSVECSTNRISGAIAGYTSPSEGLEIRYTDVDTSTFYTLVINPGDSYSFGTVMGHSYTLSVISNPYNKAYDCYFDSNNSANVTGTISSSLTTENISCNALPAAGAPSLAYTPFYNVVTMSPGASGDIVCYRTDGGLSGCALTAGGSEYSPGGFCAQGSSLYTTPVAVVSTTTFNAVSCATSASIDGSDTTSFTATIYGTVVTPTFNPAGGIYETGQSVTIATPTPGATIHFTIDGTDPTLSSSNYTAPISITTNGSQKTIKAFAVASGYISSGINASTYTIAPYPTGLTVGLPSGTTLPITWNSVSGATGYRLYRSLLPQNSGGTPIYAGTGTSFSDSGLSYSTTYYYYIIAEYSGGIISNASSYVPGGTLDASGMPAVVYGSVTPPGPEPPPPGTLTPNYWVGTKASWVAGGYTYVIFDPNYQNISEFAVSAYDSAGTLVNTWLYPGRYITSVTVNGTSIDVVRQAGTTTILWADIYPP